MSAARAAVAAVAAATVLGVASTGPSGVAGGTDALPLALQSTASVRVAYPEEPRAWYPGLDADDGLAPAADVAATDLAGLWGLPLYRIDGHGQLRPGLAAGATVRPGTDGGWAVDVRLRPGAWSDGQPVVADDVVATLAALRSHRPTELEPLAAAVALDAATVRLRFDRPYARWPYLLAGGGSVLPAHVLATAGVGAYRDGLPVSGGPYRLESHEPGLRATFVAHDAGPLGAPAIARVEVLFTPSYETALGLLADGRADVVLGHLALNPVDRAGRVDGVEAAAPLGGTTVSLRWRDGGAAGAERRRAAAAAIDVTQLVEGLLAPAGEAATSLLPGQDGPWVRDDAAGDAAALDGASVAVLVPGQQEAVGFTGRVVQRSLRGAGAEVALVPVDAEDLDGPPPVAVDAALVVRRDLPHPALAPEVPSEAAGATGGVLTQADAAAFDPAAVAAAERALRELAVRVPLYRVGVAHVWRAELDGVRPSAWPGLALWDVATWRWGSGAAAGGR